MADINYATADYPTPRLSTSRQSSIVASMKMASTSSSNSTEHNSSAVALSNLGIHHPPATSRHHKSEIADITPSTTVFKNMSSHISKENTWTFRSPARLAYRMWTTIRKCLESGTGCYILVEGVTTTMVEPIDEAFASYGIRHSVRFTFEHDLDSLIIKCMPGIEHARMSRSFIAEVTECIHGIPGHSKHSYHHTGDARFKVAGKRSREGDEGLAPSGTRKAKTGWPSFVVEVGYSQSWNSLHGAASWWLTHSVGQTRMVILIKITEGPLELHLEQWVMVDDESQQPTRSRQPKVPGMVKYWKIDAEGEVTHHVQSEDRGTPMENPDGKKPEDLIIPYRTIFDIHHDNAMDIAISKEGLKEWALHQYKGFDSD